MNNILNEVMRRRPSAVAMVNGSSAFTSIKGEVSFYQTRRGVLVMANITGLPKGVIACDSPIFAFHIHEGVACTGNAEDPFSNAMTHYNPGNCPHPYHAGDLAPLFGNDGYAFSAMLTNRFTVQEVIGRTVIIHSKPDDFTTQPSGNSGLKIACGVIRGFGKR